MLKFAEIILFFRLLFGCLSGEEYYRLGWTCAIRNATKRGKMIKYYYTKAANKGNSEAMVALGYHYLYDGVDDDAVKYYMAIKQDNTEAMIAMGDYYMHNKKHKEAAYYYAMAVVHGSRIAKTIVNKLYEKTFRSLLVGIKECSLRPSAIAQFLTAEYIPVIIKCLIELDMDIRLLIDGNVTISEPFIELYDLSKKFIGGEYPDFDFNLLDK